MIDRSQKVYFARCIGPSGEPLGAYKIGCSHGWNERIKQIASGLPFTLEVDAVTQGGFMMERALHLYLEEYRISGEYFHARGEVLETVKRCMETGNPFVLAMIKDLGPKEVPDGALSGFMRYHGIELSEVCEFLGIKQKEYEKRAEKPGFRSSKVAAAVAIIAAVNGQYVEWPTDALNGLLGEESAIMVRNREAAAADEDEDDEEIAA